MIAYFIVAVVFLSAAVAIGYLMFKAGYGCGWHDRGVEMQLPVTARRDIEKDLDERRESGRHSAIDPRARTIVLKKGVWH